MRRRLIGALALLVVALPLAQADEAKRVPKEYLEQIVDDNPDPLPRSLAPHEWGLPLPPIDQLAPLAPPTGAVYTPPEYALNQGLLMSWGSFNSLLTAMTVGVTTGDRDAVVYILVANAGQQASATSTLQGAGADMSQVEFIIYGTNTVWMRDYGPRFICEDDHRAMVDHIYNRPRPLDDAFPDFLSGLWGEPQYDLPLYHGGGNFHLHAGGDAFMSDLILTENPTLDAQDVIDFFATYENLDLTIYPGFPTWYDSTQHIDMWMLPVDSDEVIIGEYSSGDGDPHTITENVVIDMLMRGYSVHRTPGWNSGGTHYTYTNAVVFNDLVFTCEFSGYPTQNAEALATFQTAFPFHQIIPIDCSSIINYAGALHCIVMHVPAVVVPIFADDFESGTLSAWGDVVP